MNWQVSKNDNGDLLVVCNETVCVGVPVEVHTKTKDKEDSYDKDWFENWLLARIAASECPRNEAVIGPVPEDDAKALKKLTSEVLKAK